WHVSPESQFTSIPWTRSSLCWVHFDSFTDPLLYYIFLLSDWRQRNRKANIVA
ncbi:hypothetical protein BYT27DRAFT_7200089, partial [Phlegmacium glaucopus]